MSNFNFPTKEQLEELMAFISSKLNIPTVKAGGGGGSPIGTIISYMGKTAPEDYLICNGATYNIADYQSLAEHFEQQFGSKNYFGGNGTTTFAVPDLRGEFLRGTGTNSHTNQGNGATVGTHQDGTINYSVGINGPSNFVSVMVPGDRQPNATNQKVDWSKTLGWKAANKYSDSSTTADPRSFIFTSRPTNTSVLYCIKAVE